MTSVKENDISLNLECLAVEAWNREGSITIINFHNLCKHLLLSKFDEIMEKVRCPILWVGDFNAHNPLWGSDSNRAVLAEFLDM